MCFGLATVLPHRWLFEPDRQLLDQFSPMVLQCRVKVARHCRLTRRLPPEGAAECGINANNLTFCENAWFVASAGDFDDVFGARWIHSKKHCCACLSQPCAQASRNHVRMPLPTMCASVSQPCAHASRNRVRMPPPTMCACFPIPFAHVRFLIAKRNRPLC